MSKEPNLKKIRFNEMEQTGAFVALEADKLRHILKHHRIFDDGGELEDYCLKYLKEKLGKKPLRAYFSRKIYEYLSGYPKVAKIFQQYPEYENLFLKKLPFLFELIITIQYLHNHILDEKNDAKDQNHPRLIRNLISSNILRELAFQYIEQEIAPSFVDKDGVNAVAKTMRRLLLYVDIGQYLDKEYNHYWRWESTLPNILTPSPFFDDIALQAIEGIIKQVKKDVPEKGDFIDAYFQRVYLSNVYFFRCMVETIISLGGGGAQSQSLIVFSIRYGFMLQIINDYADFAFSEDKKEQKQFKTAGKKSTDFFADLYNFNITLPLIYHLRGKTGRRKIESYLEGGIKRKKILTQYPKQIMQEISQSGAIQEAILRSIELSMSAIECLDQKNPQSKFFTQMCEMAIDNKFYQHFK